LRIWSDLRRPICRDVIQQFPRFAVIPEAHFHAAGRFARACLYATSDAWFSALTYIDFYFLKIYTATILAIILIFFPPLLLFSSFLENIPR
jgi:hypothetical protein